MIQRFCTCILSLILLLPSALWATQPAPRVQVSGGVLIGMQEDGVQRFAGIPFAQPPVGDLRWRAPRAPAAWEGERDARSYAAACPQAEDRIYGLTPPLRAEDCLYLNVWAPAPAATLRPVMVWLHGGAHRMGAGSIPFYEGGSLARRGAVVVTLNYRLGYLGFFSHPALSAEDEGGNLGLMDQIAALQWVRDNIRAFGGDPEQVTVFGESAGGADVLYLMGSQRAQGLFQRAIVQSGGGWNRPLTPEAMQKNIRANLKQAGVASEADAASLRALPAETLLAAQAINRDLGFGPFLDGKTVTEAPSKAFAEGRAARIPLIIGSNDWEASLQGFQKKSWLTRTLPYFPPVMRWYEGLDAQQRSARLFTDVIFAAPARWLAARHAAHAPTWLYSFRYVTSGNRAKLPGAAHAAEIAYVFDTLGATPKSAANADDEDRRMAAALSDCWLAFARSGKPECGLAAWPAYSAEQDQLLLMDRSPRALKTPDAEALDGVVEWFGPGSRLGGG